MVRKDMEEEYGMLIMDYMKVIFIMIQQMVMENLLVLMVIFFKENGKILKRKKEEKY